MGGYGILCLERLWQCRRIFIHAMVIALASLAKIFAHTEYKAMNKIQKRRLYFVSLFLIGLAIAAGLILYALKQNINVFLTPQQLAHTSSCYQIIIFVWVAW